MRCCSKFILYSSIRFTYPIFFKKMVTMSEFHKFCICWNGMVFFVSFVVATMHSGTKEHVCVGLYGRKEIVDFDLKFN